MFNFPLIQSLLIIFMINSENSTLVILICYICLDDKCYLKIFPDILEFHTNIYFVVYILANQLITRKLIGEGDKQLLLYPLKIVNST